MLAGEFTPEAVEIVKPFIAQHVDKLLNDMNANKIKARRSISCRTLPIR